MNLRDRFGGSALLDAMNQGTETHLEIMGFLSQQGGVLELDDAAGVMCQAAADGNHSYLARLLEMNISPDVAGACARVCVPVCLCACVLVCPWLAWPDLTSPAPQPLLINLTHLPTPYLTPTSTPDYDKRTPLHLAASEGHLDCVKLLLQYWANVNPIDRMGGTPLTDAVRHGHIHIQQVLREHGGVLNMVRGRVCVHVFMRGDTNITTNGQQRPDRSPQSNATTNNNN